VNVVKTNLQDCVIIEPKVFSDPRGFFLETFQAARYATEAGIKMPFVQDNHSRSIKGVLRGFHYQLNYPQGKLVRCVSGAVFDVAVDLRDGSPTFGQAAWVILSDDNQKQFWVPPGFAHGFCVLSDVADFEYKTTNYYHPEDEYALLWSDSSLGIPWPIEHPIVSDKDVKAPLLSSIPKDKLPKLIST